MYKLCFSSEATIYPSPLSVRVRGCDPIATVAGPGEGVMIQLPPWLAAIMDELGGCHWLSSYEDYVGSN